MSFAAIACSQPTRRRSSRRRRCVRRGCFPHTTTASNWHRGIPQLISYPNSTTESATVNGIGRVLSTTNEASSVHGYSYDALGRLAGITYPTGDTPAWNGTTRSFVKVATAEYGIAAGHWKQTVQTGNGRSTTFYDAQWRPLLVLTEDVGNATSKSFVVTRYDAAGRAVFTSYPVASLTSVNDTLTGMRTFYDALNRVIRTEQDDQGSPVLVSTTDYLTGFQTRSTNPRGIQSTATYQVFDAPSTDAPVTLVAAVGQTVQQTTTIARDVFGKPTSVTRSGTYGGNAVSATRSYVYDSSERLCKTVEPETGASLIDYDAAGNVAWTTQGSTLTSLTCDRASVAVNEKTTRTYDTLNRVTQVTTPDGVANVATTYTPDGLVASLVANNLGTNNAPVTTTYTYNNRRLLQQETSLQLDAQSNPVTATVVYGYSANGHLSSHQYPTNLVVSYAPDALGRTTAVTGSDGVTYASGLGYYPNGSIAQFSYGNGVVHTLTQNPRRLPGRSQDAKLGGALVLDDTYTYDPNGNVLSITDAAQAGKTNRTMGYDALDRLTSANSSQQWNTASYAYDPLDNLRIADQGARQYRYSYDAITHRLNTISNPAGATQITLGYDVRGNVTGKTTSAGTQVLAFDRGNRLSYVAGQEYYAYDGQGRRVQSWTSPSGGSNLYVYSQGGQLLYTNDVRRSRKTDSIYLGNTLLAQRHVANGTNVVTVSYQHTDALGSVVAETDAAGNVTRRNAYAPYGEEYTTGAKVIDGQGYTGHVMDLATGFTYMQARYFDPVCACFLSADPMASDTKTGWNFNRYNYAANNPYSFIDPDGRAVAEAPIGSGLENYSVGQHFSDSKGKPSAEDIERVRSKITINTTKNGAPDWFGPKTEKLLDIVFEHSFFVLAHVASYGRPISLEYANITWKAVQGKDGYKILGNPEMGLQINGTVNHPAVVLFHEFTHLYRFASGTSSNVPNRFGTGDIASPKEERWVIDKETTFAMKHAKLKPYQPRRSHGQGTPAKY